MLNLLKIFCFLINILIVLSEKKLENKSLFQNSFTFLTNHISYKNSLNGKYLELIYFYSSWCNYCSEQKNLIKNLDKELIHWKSFIRLSAINLEPNIFREYNVSEVPSFKLVVSKKQYIDLGYDFKNEKEIIEILIKNFYNFKNQNEFRKLPKFYPLNETEISLNLNRTNKNKLLFINELNSLEKIFDSTKVILDFSSYINEIEIFNCNETVFKNSNFTSKHNHYPALYYYIKQNNSLNFIDEGIKDYNKIIVDKFLKLNITDFDKKQEDLKNEIKKNQTDLIIKDNLNKTLNSSKIYHRDINNALRVIFFVDIVRFKVLNSSQIQVLVNFTHALREYFPHDNENTRRFLRRISQWFKDHKKDQFMKAEKLKAIIKAGAEGFLPVYQPYISCKNSEINLKGYPCSIWLLFHTLTVEEYLKISKNYTKKSNVVLEPNFVLKSMQGFIKYFYACSPSSKKFLENTNLDDLKNLNSSVLWLWKKHNNFNLISQNYSNKFYPSYELCKTCYKSILNSNNISDNLSTHLNESEILNFMINTYKKSSLLRSSSEIPHFNLAFLVLILVSLILKINKFD